MLHGSFCRFNPSAYHCISKPGNVHNLSTPQYGVVQLPAKLVSLLTFSWLSPAKAGERDARCTSVCNCLNGLLTGRCRPLLPDRFRLGCCMNCRCCCACCSIGLSCCICGCCCSCCCCCCCCCLAGSGICCLGASVCPALTPTIFNWSFGILSCLWRFAGLLPGLLLCLQGSSCLRLNTDVSSRIKSNMTKKFTETTLITS